MLGSFLDDLLARAVRALHAANVRYAVCGGLALVLSGRDRNTRDLDVVTLVDAEHLLRLKEAARAEGFSHHDRADQHRLEDVMLYRFWLPIRTSGLSASFDVQQGETPFHDSVVSRARVVSVGGSSVHVATPEDLIIMKLGAYRRRDLPHPQLPGSS